MTAKVWIENDTLYSEVDGKLESVTSSELERMITEKFTDSIKAVEIDMKKVEFISSKALRVLVSIYKKVPNGNLKLINPNNMVLEVLKLTRLLNVFKIESK